ncbi:MAG: GDP-mannose 4,6-dehydratase [Alphaproteobacteria bacterium]|nr:GDP-mannose 4,6-dehydratase [Alphaproteobacteria bacterium]
MTKNDKELIFNSQESYCKGVKYLITGVDGFVGQYFVEYVQKYEPNAEILGVDIAPNCHFPIQKYNSLNLMDKKATSDMMREFAPDYIVHLASISSVGYSWREPVKCFENNTSIMLNILEAIVQNKLKTRVLSIGSSEEYGNIPMPMTEDMPLNPQNPYAVAKVSQELLGKLYAQSMGVEIVMTRSFNHIGPRQSERFVIPSFMRQLVNIRQGAENKMLVGNISVARDFSDVRDVVDAYYKILHNGQKGEVYNVCSGHAYQLHEIITMAEEILDIKVHVEVDAERLRPNDVMLILGDNTKLRTEIGWQPQYEIKQTITDILNSMRG